jgi:hypothetical protein
MRRLMARIALVCALAGSTLVVAVSGATPAGAYGHVGALNVWQVGLSFNCNNPSFCGAEDLGGFWGWVQFNQNPATGATDADAETTFCAHTPGGGGFAGAGHSSIDITGWIIQPGSAGPHTFWATGGTETDTFRGTKTTSPLTNEDGSLVTPQNPSDTGIPADPGHYSTATILGFTPPPGVALQIQVAYKPAH